MRTLVLLLLAAFLAALAVSTARPAADATRGRIVFTSDRAGNFDIYVMNPDGSGQSPITTDGADDRAPSWGK